MPNLVATCAPADIDVTGTCTHVQWVNYAGGLPPLSAAEGTVISGIIIGVWAIGFLVRRAKKEMEVSS